MFCVEKQEMENNMRVLHSNIPEINCFLSERCKKKL